MCLHLEFGKDMVTTKNTFQTSLKPDQDNQGNEWHFLHSDEFWTNSLSSLRQINILIHWDKGGSTQNVSFMASPQWYQSVVLQFQFSLTFLQDPNFPWLKIQCLGFKLNKYSIPVEKFLLTSMLSLIITWFKISCLHVNTNSSNSDLCGSRCKIFWVESQAPLACGKYCTVCRILFI